MRLIDYRQKNFTQVIDSICTRELYDYSIEKSVQGILDEVRKDGDKALLKFALAFDKFKLKSAAGFRVVGEIDEKQIAPELKKALKDALRNVKQFAAHGHPKDWCSKNSHGGFVGEKFFPYDRVGVYIPGGTAPLVSTCLMTITLAKEAGVKEIVVCSPAGRDGKLHTALQYAAELAGATEIYMVGGAQAIAAMAFGTKTIKPVQKIVGPGNAYVTTAKRLLYGYVDLDMVAGPSEVVILSDRSADPKHIAIDLLAQIEHGSGHERAFLVTTSKLTALCAMLELCKFSESHSRREFTKKAMKKNVYFIVVPDMQEGITIVNRLAPEHLEVQAKNPNGIALKITRAGAIFIGKYTPEAVGDYVAGPSHVLPTGGSAASFSGLTVSGFYRRTSFVEYNKESLRKSAASIQAIAMAEGLEAHADSARIRLSN
ncbi:MAG: histidinol dehydrogenase [Verrucomicrobiota bacterium]|nr:histidinol dehydrogenase [Verrucomicrobiota bacterium]